MHVNFHSPIYSFPRFVFTIYVVFINARVFFSIESLFCRANDEFQIFSFMRLLGIRSFCPKVGSPDSSSPTLIFLRKTVPVTAVSKS